MAVSTTPTVWVPGDQLELIRGGELADYRADRGRAVGVRTRLDEGRL